MPANSSHVADVVNAVRTRVTTLSSLFGEIDVEIGNPAQFHPRADSSPPLVTIFVYRIEPNNAMSMTTPDTATAMRLHVLITVFCTTGVDESESAGSLELRILSHIIRLFHESSRLGPIRIREAVPIGPVESLVTSDLLVEAQQMAPDMEEINHIWTTQADTPYRTSLVYRLSSAFVTPSQPSDEGPPVLSTALSDIDNPETNDVGVTPFLSAEEQEPAPALGVLTINTGTAVAPQFVPTIGVIVGSGDLTIDVVAVTEDTELLDLVLESFDQNSGQWVDVSADLSVASISTLRRQVLQDGGAVVNTSITIAEPATVGVLRLVASRTVEPESLLMSPVTITVEDSP